MGNVDIYNKLIDIEGRLTSIEEKLDSHLCADKDGKTKSWGFWEKVIMVFISAGVGALSAKFGFK